MRFNGKPGALDGTGRPARLRGQLAANRSRPMKTADFSGDRPLLELMRDTRSACEDGLRRADLRDAQRALERAGVDQARMRELVVSMPAAVLSQGEMSALLSQLSAAGYTNGDASIERTLLLCSAAAALSNLEALPVVDSVKALYCEEVQSWTRLDDASKPGFRCGTARFVDMCQLASLRRFPAGQFDWVRGGLPLSYLLGVSYWNLPKALYVTIARLRGRSPVFFTHLGYHLSGASLSEREANRSYYRMARSMELQPDIKGLVASSWFRSPDTHRVSPHLAWVNTVVVENGGFVAVRGRAKPDCGVFVRSPTRRRLYETGEFRPTLGLVIWPRRAMLEWAAAHPELDDAQRLPAPARFKTTVGDARNG
jgi:hypothetical protein